MHLQNLDRSGAELLLVQLQHQPVRHCYVASRLEQLGRLYWQDQFSDFLVAFQDGSPHSALLTGANLVPINTTVESRQLFAEVLRVQPRRCSAIIGPHDEVSHLWELLEESWGPYRDIRLRQYVMAIHQDSDVRRDESVRFAHAADLDDLFPVCVEMFTAELGVSPLRDGGHSAYRARVSELISSRRAFVKYSDGQVVFKAEVGSVGIGVAQLQGVWMHPDLRGHGLSASALAQVIHLVRMHLAPTVSLVVNDFNQPAIKAYSSVGFTREDTFTTILF